MLDPIEDPDVHFITKDGRRIPIPGRPLSPEERGAMAKRQSKEGMRAALQTQKEVAKLLGGRVIPDNKAFDVVVGKNWIEVKTNIEGKNDRVHMQRTSREKKEAWAGFNKWTLAVDKRAFKTTGKVAYYLFPGTGAFRYGKLIPTPLSVIQQIMGGG